MSDKLYIKLYKQNKYFPYENEVSLKDKKKLIKYNNKQERNKYRLFLNDIIKGKDE